LSWSCTGRKANHHWDVLVLVLPISHSLTDSTEYLTAFPNFMNLGPSPLHRQLAKVYSDI